MIRPGHADPRHQLVLMLSLVCGCDSARMYRVVGRVTTDGLVQPVREMSPLCLDIGEPANADSIARDGGSSLGVASLVVPDDGLVHVSYFTDEEDDDDEVDGASDPSSYTLALQVTYDLAFLVSGELDIVQLTDATGQVYRGYHWGEPATKDSPCTYDVLEDIGERAPEGVPRSLFP